MARVCRIDSYVTRKDGSIYVGYTIGEAPLPKLPSGYGSVFASLDDLQFERSRALVDTPDDVAIAMALEPYLKDDPLLSIELKDGDVEAAADIATAIEAKP